MKESPNKQSKVTTYLFQAIILELLPESLT